MQQDGSYRIPRTILGGAFLLAFSLWSPMYCIPPMQHILKEVLSLSHFQTSLLFIAPLFMIVAISMPAGILADRIGVRKAAGIGAIILAVGSVLRATATSASSLLAFTFIYGAGIGWSLTNLPKLISAWFPRERAGTATGIYSIGLFAGIALPMAITVSHVFPISNSFQGVFLIWSIPPIITAAMWWILVRNPPLSHIHDESVAKDKISLRRVFRDRYLWLVAFYFVLSNFFFYTWSGWAPSLLLLKGATPELAGLIGSVFMWVAIPAAFLMPKLVNKVGLRKPFLWITGVVLALVSWVMIQANIMTSWFIMGIAGVTHNIRFMNIMILPVEMMPKEQVGAATGLINSLGYAGGIVGPLIGGFIFDSTGKLDIALIILIGLSIASAGIGFILPETGPRAKMK